jgi:uroporphyrinogen-III synthase
MPVKILYTGNVEKEFIVNDNEIQIDYEPLIDIQFSNDRSVLNKLRELEMQKAFVVVTSQNALAFLKKNVTTKPSWSIACIDGATLQEFKKMGWLDLVVYTASNAASLAEKIVLNEKPQTIYFFTNSIRTAILPDLLKAYTFNLLEICVYETLELQKHFREHYDGIAFLSPSAVNSFFQNNKTSDETVFFSIGQTTASSINKHSSNKVVIAKAPTPQDIIKSIQQYYFKK